jgi:hypothetical protein
MSPRSVPTVAVPMVSKATTPVLYSQGWCSHSGRARVAAPAHADEDSYVATLDAMGVPHRNRPAAIQFGEVICRALACGTPVSTLVTMTTSDGYYSGMQANALIGAAQGGLCPQVRKYGDPYLSIRVSTGLTSVYAPDSRY